jgi:hypothetical protein
VNACHSGITMAYNVQSCQACSNTAYLQGFSESGLR